MSFFCLRAGKLSHISVVLWEIYQEYSHERALVVYWDKAVLVLCGGEIFADTISMLFWLDGCWWSHERLSATYIRSF